MADVIDHDGVVAHVPDACPFCGATKRGPIPERQPSVIGNYECGTAKNFRPDGQHSQTQACLEAAPAFAVAAAKAQIAAWLREDPERLQQTMGLCDADYPSTALWMAADLIEVGAPERWSAEREGERG